MWDTPLITAVKKGDVAQVSLLLNSGSDINIRDFRGLTALYHSLDCENEELVALLIAAGANVNTHVVSRAIMLAACNFSNSKKILYLLLHAGVELNKVDKHNLIGQTPLLEAVSYREKETVAMLIEAGADVNVETCWGSTALWCDADSNCTTDILPLLIQAGADVNKRYGCGKTPLIYAVSRSEKERAALLIEAGADVNAVCTKQLTPLSYVVRPIWSYKPFDHRKDILSMLIQAGADVNKSDGGGRTPLMDAVVYKDVCGWTPLSHAADSAVDIVGSCHSEMVSLIISHDAYINCEDNDGNTALCHMVEHHFVYGTVSNAGISITKCLIEHGADVNTVGFLSRLCGLVQNGSQHGASSNVNNYQPFVVFAPDLWYLAIKAGLRLQQSQAVCALLDWYKSNERQAPEDITQLVHCLQQHLTCPASLQDMTKVIIRDHLVTVTRGRSIYRIVESLQIPHTCIQSILLKD